MRSPIDAAAASAAQSEEGASMLKRVDRPKADELDFAPVEGRETAGFDLREAINFVWRAVEIHRSASPRSRC